MASAVLDARMPVDTVELRQDDGACNVMMPQPGTAGAIARGMDFKVLGRIRDIETIAIGNAIREIRRLRRHYGFGRWRKRKGIARVELRSGTIRLAEIHWYEAHGIGRYELKIKDYLD